MEARVEIRTGRLDRTDNEVAALWQLIGADERSRARQFHFERDRRRFIVRRGLLRRWLGAYLGERPQSLEFTANAWGKPALAGHRLYFNQSHSGELTLLAIAMVEVGCDIEQIDTALDWRPLADGLFTASERADLGKLPPARARRAFFDCWARKEAFVKALGQGLSYPLDAFDVSVGSDACLLRGADGWSISSPEIPHYAAAVIAKAGAIALHMV